MKRFAPALPSGGAVTDDCATDKSPSLLVYFYFSFQRRILSFQITVRDSNGQGFRIVGENVRVVPVLPLREERRRLLGARPAGCSTWLLFVPASGPRVAFRDST